MPINWCESGRAPGISAGFAGVATPPLARGCCLAVCGLDRPQQPSVSMESEATELLPGMVGTFPRLLRVHAHVPARFKEHQAGCLLVTVCCRPAQSRAGIHSCGGDSYLAGGGPMRTSVQHPTLMGDLFVPTSVRSEVIQWGHASQLACHPGPNHALHPSSSGFGGRLWLRTRRSIVIPPTSQSQLSRFQYIADLSSKKKIFEIEKKLYGARG